jgi:hypothetical protein
MKKIIIAGIAAVAAVASFASTASADSIVKYKNGWHRPHATVVVRPRARVYVAPRRVYVAPRVVYRDDCFTKKVRRVNNYGNVVIKRVRVCR